MSGLEQARGDAPRRAVSAMLRTLGGEEVWLRTTAPAGSVDTRGLGLQQYDVAEVRLTPALVRQSTEEFWEVLLAANEVEISLGTTTNGARGILLQSSALIWKTRLFHIENVETEQFAGCEYLVRVTMRERDANG